MECLSNNCSGLSFDLNLSECQSVSLNSDLIFDFGTNQCYHGGVKIGDIIERTNTTITVKANMGNKYTDGQIIEYQLIE